VAAGVVVVGVEDVAAVGLVAGAAAAMAAVAEAGPLADPGPKPVERRPSAHPEGAAATASPVADPGLLAALPDNEPIGRLPSVLRVAVAPPNGLRPARAAVDDPMLRVGLALAIVPTWVVLATDGRISAVEAASAADRMSAAGPELVVEQTLVDQGVLDRTSAAALEWATAGRI